MNQIAICLSIFICTIVSLHAGDGSSSRPDCQVKLKDGRILNYQEYGVRDGKLVLWFHGLNSSSRVPEIVSQEICRAGLRVICFDRPGIGKSTAKNDRTILGWVNDVKEFTSAIGCGNGKFGIITTSGGSSYGCACAVKIPHRVTHLALVSPFAPFDARCVKPGNATPPTRLAANHPKIAYAAAKNTIRKLEKNPDQVMKRFKRKYSPADVELVFGNPVNYQNRINNLRHISRQGPCGVIVDARLHAGDWGYQVCQVRHVPVTIWAGGEDPVTPPSMAKYFQCQIKGSRLFIGEKDGHSTLLKNKARSILSQF